MTRIRFIHKTRAWLYRWPAVPRVGDRVSLPDTDGDPTFRVYTVETVEWMPLTEAVDGGALTVHARPEGCSVDVGLSRKGEDRP